MTSQPGAHFRRFNMTTSFERTQSLLLTRQLLKDLASHTDKLDPELLRGRAATLLRHFPEPVHVALSSEVLPDVWSHPNAKWYE